MIIYFLTLHENGNNLIQSSDMNVTDSSSHEQFAVDNVSCIPVHKPSRVGKVIIKSEN